MRIYLLIIAMLISVSAFAEKVIIANCSEGSGCSFELSDFENDLLENDFGRKIESGDIVVLGKKKNGAIITYLDKKTRAAIDKEWGGDGYTQLSVFNPHIQPLNGLWNVAYGTSTGNDCYGIGNIGAAFRKQITPGTAGNGNIKFEFPFSPFKLFPSADMRWVKTGYNTYKGLLDLGSNNIGGMKMYYNVTIVSNRKIETAYHVEIKVPTKPLCKAQIPVTFSLIKAEQPEDMFEGSEPYKDDLLPVHPKGNKDDLLEVKPKDDLLPVEPGKKPKPKVDRLDQPKVDRIED